MFPLEAGLTCVGQKDRNGVKWNTNNLNHKVTKLILFLTNASYCCKVENAFGLVFLVVVDVKISKLPFHSADRQVVPDELSTVSKLLNRRSETQNLSKR